MARANVGDCARLAAAIAPLRLSTRDVGGWLGGHPKTRALVLSEPALYLRARQEEQRAAAPPSELAQLMEDLGALGGIARRARRRLTRELISSLLPHEREECAERIAHALADLQALGNRLGTPQETKDAGPEHEDCDPQAA